MGESGQVERVAMDEGLKLFFSDFGLELWEIGVGSVEGEEDWVNRGDGEG